MKEPVLAMDGVEHPYSRAPSDWLRESVNWPTTADEPNDIIDEDFMNRYAAIILRERGQ